MNVTKDIAQGRCCLGIELGSTRIKAVLIGSDHSPVASGEHGWRVVYGPTAWRMYGQDSRGLMPSCAAMCPPNTVWNLLPWPLWASLP